VKALIFDGLGIIFYPLCYEIFILRCSPFFWRSTYLLLFFFSPVKGKACVFICGDPFSFFSLSWMRWGVRNLRGIQFAVSSFYIMYEPLPHAAYWMFSNLDGHTFYFLWYCKERADSCDAVFAEHVSYTSWPFFFFFFFVFGLLSYFRSILGTSVSVDYTCHVAMASTFALWQKMFLK